MTKNDLKLCVESIGGYSKAARELGTTKQVVWSWVHVLKKVPPKWVNAFSVLSGEPRHKIRPDIYPKDRELAN